ncbi:unnamed protein product, partial [Scytosiphon promiscuus]
DRDPGEREEGGEEERPEDRVERGGGQEGAGLVGAEGSEPRPSGRGDGEEDVVLRPMMLSYTIPEQEQHRRVRVRLEGSTWSPPFSLDQSDGHRVLEVSGAPRGGLALQQKENDRERRKSLGWRAARRERRRESEERQAFPVGISIKAAPAPFHRTNVVALAPRYVIVNAMDRPIEVQQAGLGEDTEPLKVRSGGRAPFHWPRAGAGGWFGSAAAAGAKNRRLVLRFCGGGGGDGEVEGEREKGWDWSGEIVPEGGESGVGRGLTTLRLRNRLTREVAFVRVGTSVKGSSVHLVFRRELPSFAPYRIDNFTLETLTLRQVGGNVVETLLPCQTCIYSWDEPLGDRSLIVERFLVEGYL